MTPKQEERIREKIKAIRAGLAAEKRLFGGYDDSSGSRYLPPSLFLKIGDYRGGLTYLRWFAKNFPDDIGLPDFLFEWTLILFKNGKIPDAERKAIETYFSNTYLLAAYLDLPEEEEKKEEWMGTERIQMLDDFSYTKVNTRWADFTYWLNNFYNTESFRITRNQFIEVKQQLLRCENLEQRAELLGLIRQMKEAVLY